MKRHYDSYHPGGPPSRGGYHPGSFPPGFKKYRREDVDPVNPTPSKVLHIRNLTQDTTEADLLAALSHFGNVAYTTLMANGHMALAEFATIEMARACIAYSKSHQIMVRNHPVLINYSTSEKIQRAGLEGEEPSRVIVLTITNVSYPITVDILKEICSEHGTVNRVALIKRAGMLQALVEFENQEQATKAKYGLNGADIYDNACTLKVEFGRMEVVKVTANNADQWDYTCDPAEKNGSIPPTGDIESLTPALATETIESMEKHSPSSGDSTWRSNPRRHEPDPSLMQPNSYSSTGGYVPHSESNGFRGRGAPYRPRGRGGTYIPEVAARSDTGGFFNDRTTSYGDGYTSRERGGGSAGGGGYRGRGGGPPPPRSGGSGGGSWHAENNTRFDDRYDNGGGAAPVEYYGSRAPPARPETRPPPGNSSWRDRSYAGRDREYEDEYHSSGSSRYSGREEYDRGSSGREHGTGYNGFRERGAESGGGHENYYRDRGERPERDYDRGHERGGFGAGGGHNGSVVMVYGVASNFFTCDRLFNILCCYGNCLRIKYMHSKPDTCMVQMGSPEQAASVIEHLQDVEVFGTRLTFRPSKQNVVHVVREPHTLFDGSAAFRDYEQSTVHRFSTPEMAAANRVVLPNPQLFWYDAPPVMSEDGMRKLFSQKNAPLPLEVKLLESTASSRGLLRFASTRDASEALMIANNMVVVGGVSSAPFVIKLAYASPEFRSPH